jgi:hypothetical protein
MQNYSEDIHTMVCERVLDNGIDVFVCPACGRKMLIQWTPVLRQVVLEPGDEAVVHSATPYTSADESPEVLWDDPAYHETTDDIRRLAEWEQWLREIEFETWWV